jgi:hypothetical protein
MRDGDEEAVRWLSYSEIARHDRQPGNLGRRFRLDDPTARQFRLLALAAA